MRTEPNSSPETLESAPLVRPIRRSVQCCITAQNDDEDGIGLHVVAPSSVHLLIIRAVESIFSEQILQHLMEFVDRRVTAPRLYPKISGGSQVASCHLILQELTRGFLAQY